MDENRRKKTLKVTAESIVINGPKKKAADSVVKIIIFVCL